MFSIDYKNFVRNEEQIFVPVLYGQNLRISLVLIMRSYLTRRSSDSKRSLVINPVEKFELFSRLFGNSQTLYIHVFRSSTTCEFMRQNILFITKKKTILRRHSSRCSPVPFSSQSPTRSPHEIHKYADGPNGISVRSLGRPRDRRQRWPPQTRRRSQRPRTRRRRSRARPRRRRPPVGPPQTNEDRQHRHGR